MIIRFKDITAMCTVALLVFGWARSTQSQVKQIHELLDQPVKELRIKEPTINVALAKVAGEYRVPIGIEMAARRVQSQDNAIAIYIEDGTVRDVLSAVIKEDPRYGWQIIDGVVNVYPRTNHDNLLSDLLDTRVQEFSLAPNSRLYGIRNKIIELPEIKSKLKQANVAPHIVAYTGIDFAKLEGFSIRLSNITLRQLLNHIVRDSEAKFWILNRFGKNNEFLILNF